MATIESTSTQPAEAPRLSVLEELDRALRTLEENIFTLHGRLDLVSMRELKEGIGQVVNGAESSLHISALITRVHIANEVLNKMINELQV